MAEPLTAETLILMAFLGGAERASVVLGAARIASLVDLGVCRTLLDVAGLFVAGNGAEARLSEVKISGGDPQKAQGFKRR